MGQTMLVEGADPPRMVAARAELLSFTAVEGVRGRWRGGQVDASPRKAYTSRAGRSGNDQGLSGSSMAKSQDSG